MFLGCSFQTMTENSIFSGLRSRVPTAQWKTENGQKDSRSGKLGKHREFGNFAKTQGIWFARVVNSVILKVKEMSIFAANIF